MWIRIIGYTLVGVAIITIGYVMYRNSQKERETLVFSPVQLLTATWQEYKDTYLEDGTLRTLDPSRENITTSEGQSYTMLRAVWMGDKETFDTSWQWTKDNLQHEEDKLFSWLFGRRSNGTFGVLTEKHGETSASDGDTDIALALLFAYGRWQDENYLNEATSIISDIWEKEVVAVRGRPYLASNNIEKFATDDWILINPSYLHPAAYRIFAEVDTEHPWRTLANTSYDILKRSSQLPLDKEKSAGLPPDWVEINRESGALRAPPNPLTTNFGFDAMRTPWRVALDAQWFGRQEAKDMLAQWQFLSREWERQGMLNSSYAHDGSVILPSETAAMYGTTIGYFAISDPSNAQRLYEEKLAFLFDPGNNSWRNRLSYYDDNWAWFGIALYNNLTPNLVANLLSSAH
ncbi:MAG TPA: glycosyl hydrolase family 8 [Candidatus Paceibacterota bacterium]|nr:glycosyl hydrolase family 8 [Candidatus Paceibacterota bacterium]